jgi:hypothetical protein
MLKSILLTAAVMLVAAGPAFAADGDCGSAPLAPAIPSANDEVSKTVEAARADVFAAYHQVKAFQAALKPFRECLVTQAKNDQASLDAATTKNDKDAIGKAKQVLSDRQKIYDGTIDTEQQVATDFNNLRVAQCTRDTDPSVCPKKP